MEVSALFEFGIFKFDIAVVESDFFERNALTELGVSETDVSASEFGGCEAAKGIFIVTTKSGILEVGVSVAEFGTLKVRADHECCIFEVSIPAIEFDISKIGTTTELGILKVSISTVEHSTREVCFAAEFHTRKICVSMGKSSISKISIPFESSMGKINFGKFYVLKICIAWKNNST